MKKVLYYISVLCVSMISLASCKQDINNPVESTSLTHKVTFTASAPETKTTMDIDGSKVTFNWEEEDLERLEVYENNVAGVIIEDQCTIEDGKLTIVALFEGESTTETNEYYAVLNGVVENQTPREDSYDAEADVLVSEVVPASSMEEGIMFCFSRVVAISKMTLCDIPVGETISTVTINADQPLSGIIDGRSFSSDPELLGNSIVLTVNKAIPENGQLPLYFITLPVDEATLSVSATTVTGKTYSKTFGRTLSLTAGNVKGYSVGMKEQAQITLTENFNSTATTATTYNGTSLTQNIASMWDYVWSYDGDVYVNNSSVRFGKASTTGSISNNSILALIPTGTEFIVNVYAAQWEDAATMKVTYNSIGNTFTPSNGVVSKASTADYSSDHFTTANSFTFTKVENVDMLTIGNDSKRVMIDKIDVIYFGEAPSAINAADITNVAAAGVSNQSFQFSTTNVSGNPAVSCDGTVVTLASVEGNTVTYSVSANTTYKAREGSITITVGEISKTITVSQDALVPEYDHDGTASDPYTISDALLKISTLDAETQSEEVYVTGVISSIESFSEEYGSITYVLGSGNQTLKIYGGLDFNGVKFANQNDLIANQTVVVCGKLEEYNGNGEMASNSKLVSVNGKDYLLKSISVSGAKTQFDQGDEFSSEGAVVKAQYRGNKAETTVSGASFEGFNSSTTGQQTITVSYSEDGITKTTTYNIIVADATEYTITVNSNDTSLGTVTVTSEGNDITKSKAGKTIVVFVEPEEGCVVDEFKVNNTVQTLSKNSYEFTMPSSAVTISVNFRNVGSEYGTVVFDFSSTTELAKLGITAPSASSGTTLQSCSVTPITISNTKNGNTVTRVWNSSNSYDLRAYSGAELSFTSTSNVITRIQFEGTALFEEVSNGIWTGSSTSVVLNGTSTSKITKITVTYGNPPVSLTDLLWTGYTSSYTVDDEFSIDGTIKAKYSDGSEKELDANEVALTTAPDLSVAGSTYATISYSEGEITKTATVSITVNTKGGGSKDVTVLSEEFDNSTTADSSSEFDSKKFSNFSGATSKAYTSKYGGVKLGSGSAAGYITSKSLDLSESFTVSLNVLKYGSDTGSIMVTVGEVNQYITPTATDTVYSLDFDAATSTSTIKIATTAKRAYIDNVVVVRHDPSSDATEGR